ncbi:hypothetical protein Tco_0668554 [Tanacetum coccineum]
MYDWYIRIEIACQQGRVTVPLRNQIPLTNILVSEVEAEALPTNDARVVVKFLRKLFSRFGVPKALIDLDTTGKHRYLQLNKLAELRNEAYEHSRAYKERTKRWHDAKIMDKEFHEGDEDSLYEEVEFEVSLTRETRLFYRRFKRIHLLQSSLEEESNAQGSLLF